MRERWVLLNVYEKSVFTRNFGIIYPSAQEAKAEVERLRVETAGQIPGKPVVCVVMSEDELNELLLAAYQAGEMSDPLVYADGSTGGRV